MKRVLAVLVLLLAIPLVGYVGLRLVRERRMEREIEEMRVRVQAEQQAIAKQKNAVANGNAVMPEEPR